MDPLDLANRFTFHEKSRHDNAEAHSDVRGGCLQLAKLIDALVPDGREKSLAITHLEDAMMWANAGLARSG